MGLVTPPSPGTRILITGASRGIGLEVARDLHAVGCQIWLIGQSDTVHRVAEDLQPSPPARSLDVGDPSSVASLFDEIGSVWSGLDAIINAAAVLGEAGHFWDADEHRFSEVLRTNTVAAFSLVKNFVQLRRAAINPTGSRGKVILFAGGGAAYGYPTFLPYGASKAALVRMCETMAMELDAAGIPVDVNVIAPGANETAMLARVRAAGGEVRTTVPFSKPIALCRWLASAASDGVSGRFLHVNDSYVELIADELSSDVFKLRRVDP